MEALRQGRNGLCGGEGRRVKVSEGIKVRGTRGERDARRLVDRRCAGG